MAEKETELKVFLKDPVTQIGQNVTIRRSASGYGIDVLIDGFGDACSASRFGVPVYIENYDGDLRVVVWSEIANENPTHLIPLRGAREG